MNLKLPNIGRLLHILPCGCYMIQPSGREQVAVSFVELVRRVVKRQNKLQACMSHLVASKIEHGCKHAEDHQVSAEQSTSPSKQNPVTINIRAPRHQVWGLAIAYNASCVCGKAAPDQDTCHLAAMQLHVQLIRPLKGHLTTESHLCR